MRELLDQELKVRYLQKFDFDRIFDERIYDCSRLYEYDKGDSLVEVGMSLTHMLFLVKGEAKVYASLENGKVYLLRNEAPLNVFGDVEILRGQDCTAYVSALNQCHVIGIPVVNIRRDYYDHPPFLQYIIGSLANKLVEIGYKSSEDSLMPLKNKLASFLLAHMDEETQIVKFRPSLSDVAEQLGSTYRHLARIFKELSEEGMIEKQGKKIRVLNKSELRKLAGEPYKY